MAKTSKKFKASYKKGKVFEDKIVPFLYHFSESSNCNLLSVEQILPVDQYRIDNRRFPDFMLTDKNIATNKQRMLVEVKRKNGWYGNNGNIYITIQKNMLDDYISVARDYNAPLMVIIYCDLTKSAYGIDNFTNMKSLSFNNEHGNEESYIFYVSDLVEIPEMKDII